MFKGDLTSGKVINHKDGVKTNNRLSNLEEVTPSVNTQHAHDTGLQIISSPGRTSLSLQNRGENHRDAKITEELVRKMRKFYHRKSLQGWSMRSVAARVHDKLDYISFDSIREVLMGRTWKHVK